MKLCLTACSLLFLTSRVLTAEVTITPGDAPPLRWVQAEIERAAQGQPVPDVTIRIDDGPPQSYRIERDGTAIQVIGGDLTGAMYGGLDVAEAIRLGTLARTVLARTHAVHRVPRDQVQHSRSICARPVTRTTPTAAQANIPEMWSIVFWREFFDEMARHRFNVISLWSLHPFPSIVKVPEYPDVALDDVLRAQAGDFDDSYSHSGRDMFRPELLADAEVVRRMTIDEKIAFWREVMQIARDRGVDVYWFTWNTFLFGAEGKHGLSRETPDDNMIHYFRASVRETVKTYPLLAGMGITAGEHMSPQLAGHTKEQWLWQTYGEGIRDGLRDTTDRPFRLIHRFHQTDLQEIRDEWRELPCTLDFSYKYAVAHMYASTRPPLH